jgi:hypothetical protein
VENKEMRRLRRDIISISTQRSIITTTQILVPSCRTKEPPKARTHLDNLLLGLVNGPVVLISSRIRKKKNAARGVWYRPSR